MNLEFATTEDMLTELRRRPLQFIFVGDLNPNVRKRELVCAYKGSSRRELAGLLRFFCDRVLVGNTDDRY